MAAMLTTLASAVLTLGLSYLPVAAAPGPNFMVVSRAGLLASHLGALRAAAGVAFGAALIATLTASGMGLLPRDERLLLLAEVLFAALLLRFALCSFRQARTAGAAGGGAAADDRHFRIGFLTAVSNPFTAMFLATAVRTEIGGVAAGSAVFLVAVSWFGLVGIAFCHPALRALYERRRGGAEALIGLVLLAMSARAFLHAVGGLMA